MLFWCHDELHFISCHSQYDRIEFQMQQSMYCILSSSTATHFEETFDSYLSSKLLVSLMLPTQLCVMLLALLGGAGIILCCLNVSWCWTFTTIFEFKYSNSYQNHIIAFYWKISYDIFLSAFRLSILFIKTGYIIVRVFYFHLIIDNLIIVFQHETYGI